MARASSACECRRVRPARAFACSVGRLRRERRGADPASGPGPWHRLWPPGRGRARPDGRNRRACSSAGPRRRHRRPWPGSTSRRPRWCRCSRTRRPGRVRRIPVRDRAGVVAGSGPRPVRARGPRPARRPASVLHHLSRCRPFRATRRFHARDRAGRRPGAAQRRNRGFPRVRLRAGNVAGLGAKRRSPIDVQNRSLVNGIRHTPVTEESSTSEVARPWVRSRAISR